MARRREWQDHTIETNLRALAAVVGRMPTKNEIKTKYGQGFAQAVTRYGGYWNWTKRLKLDPNCDEASGHTRLSEDDVLGVIAMVRRGATTREIENKYGISRATVSKFRARAKRA